MFNRSKPNVILISDQTDIITMNRSLGVHKVAYCLREAGFEVAVIHYASVFSINEIFHMLKELVNENTLFVGVNNYFYASIADPIVHDYGGVELRPADPGSIVPHGSAFNQQIKDLIRRQNKKCKLVLGGPTAIDVDYNKIFDYIVKGYAEQSVVQLARFLNEEPVQLPKKYKSVFGPVIVDDIKAEGYDFSRSHMGYEDHDVILPGETLLLEVARGCIFKCAFCSYPMNGKKKMDFIRSMELIREELIDNYSKYQITNYVVVDDTFNDSVEKCRIFSDMVKTLPFKINLWAYVRLDLLTAHPETIDYLVDAGFRAMWFGIETLNPRTASIIGKGGDREKLLGTVRHIKEKYNNKVSMHGSFVFGLPHESMESMQSTAEYLLSDKNPLDSWSGYPLNIRANNESITQAFLSDIDTNYKKYGYEDIGASVVPNRSLYSASRLGEHGHMNWKNEHTSSAEVEEFASNVHRLKKQKRIKVGGQFAFYGASTGHDLEDLINKYESEVDWHQFDKDKLARAMEYKIKLFEKLEITPNFLELGDIQTFGDLLRSRKLVELSFDFANKNV